MTAQVSDSLRMMDETFSLQHVHGQGLFDPADHGWEVRDISTACWRGYVCGYALVGAQLVLETLYVGHVLPREVREEAHWAFYYKREFHPPDVPKLGEWTGTWEESPHYFSGVADYRDMALPIPFTGTLLACTDFIRELYVHMGFHPAWKFRRVLELTLEDGLLTHREDVSEQIARTREARRDVPMRPPRDASAEEMLEWIRGSFEWIRGSSERDG